MNGHPRSVYVLRLYHGGFAPKVVPWLGKKCLDIYGLKS